MSETIGWDERMNDSLQQVHSWKWNQTTGRRGFVSSALTTCARRRRLYARGRSDPAAELDEVTARISLTVRMLPDGEGECRS